MRFLQAFFAVSVSAAGAAADECDVVAAKIVETTGAAYQGKNGAGMLTFALTPYRVILGCYESGTSVQIFSDDKFPSARFASAATLIAAAAVSVAPSAMLGAYETCKAEYLRDPSFFPSKDIPGAHIQCGGPGFFFSADSPLPAHKN